MENLNYYITIGCEIILNVVSISLAIIYGTKNGNLKKVIQFFKNVRNKVEEVEDQMNGYQKVGTIKKDIVKNYAENTIVVNNIKGIDENEVDEYIEDTVKLMNKKKR